jgi:hypothetical protein
MQKLKVIDEFKNYYEMFSNFYPVLIYYAERNFPSVEHAFVASKSDDPMVWYKVSQIPEDQAGKAKRFGKKIKLRKNWDIIKLSYMKRFLMQKFSYQRFKELLLSTGDTILIEGNYWHDNYWGDCYCPKCVNIIGQNQLGKMLMKVRNIIK